jgi:TatA/E family protein of Tat protein translocase
MNLGFTEMAFIFILALLIFGPRKLPELGRQLGRALTEFKRASNEFKYQIEHEMREIEAEALAKTAATPPPAAPPDTEPAAYQPYPPSRENAVAETDKSADA